MKYYHHKVCVALHVTQLPVSDEFHSGIYTVSVNIIQMHAFFVAMLLNFSMNWATIFA